MWHFVGATIFLIYFFLIMQESHKREKEICRLSSKCYNLEEENKKLKIGRDAYNIGDEIVYFTQEESKRYDKWQKFYDFDKMEKVGVLSPEEKLNIIISGILENESNETILQNLIIKSNHIK